MAGLTEEQKRRIEENRKKAMEKRAISPLKPACGSPSSKPSFHLSKGNNAAPSPIPVPPKPRTASDIEANRLKALEKLKARKALTEKRETISEKLHPERTSPTKSKELVNNYFSKVLNEKTESKRKLVMGDEKSSNVEDSRAVKHSNMKTNNNDNNKFSVASSSSASTSASEHGKAAQFYGQKNSKIKASCVLVDRYRFKVTSEYFAPLIDVFKSMKTRSYDAMSKEWSFKLEDYDLLMSRISPLQITVSPLPKPVLSVFKNHLKGRYSERRIPTADLSNMDDQYMVSSLMPFQLDGVSFGINKNGRLLLADDMGLGKSIQAICLAAYYRRDWPLLVVCPSSLRFAWKEHFSRWLTTVPDIKVCITGKDKCDSLINIISYDLLAKKSAEILMSRFQVVIVDESHVLKSGKTARTRAALPILKQARRVMLLSGTPALSRPNELFTQVQAVDPKLFTSFHDFGVRYCNGKQMPWGWDFSGASNMAELQILLEENIMIRRLKSDVIKQLPSKRREMILLDPELIKKSDGDFKAAEKNFSGKIKGSERYGLLLAYYQQTAKVKVNAVKNYVLDLLESGKKFLLFAHHAVMLDALQTALESKYEYIRIDGSTPAETRKLLCDRFQMHDDVKIALLSITAANTGLNLTAACLVVFAELFWNPGVLTQAEDRVHRIGQEDSVLVHYLVATNTADDYMWPLIQAKLDVLGKAGLSKDNFSDVGTVVSSAKNHAQNSILDYFQKHSDDILTEDGVVEGKDVKKEVAQEGAKKGNDAGDDVIDWDDEDEEKDMVEALAAVESASEKSNDKAGEKNSSKISTSSKQVNSKLWNLASQQNDVVKVSVSVDSKSKPDVNKSYDWLDSIDEEMSILASGPDVKRRKTESN